VKFGGVTRGLSQGGNLAEGATVLATVGGPLAPGPKIAGLDPTFHCGSGNNIFQFAFMLSNENGNQLLLYVPSFIQLMQENFYCQ